MRYSFLIIRGIIGVSMILSILIIGGCSYFEVYKKTSYVSQVTTVIKANQDEIDTYIQLTNNKDTFSDKEMREKFAQIKEVFTTNKKGLEAINPPQDYKDEHDGFVKGFQNCIDSVDASVAVLDATDDKVRFERVEEAKGKIEEAKKLIKKSLNSISIDLR